MIADFLRDVLSSLGAEQYNLSLVPCQQVQQKSHSVQPVTLQKQLKRLTQTLLGILPFRPNANIPQKVCVDFCWGCSIALWQKMHDRQRSRLTNNVQRPTDCATQDLNVSATATQTHNTQLR